mgnify:CR=1 FL=1
MINLIMPMAGGGTRFKNNEIDIPKPLIEINGKPFFFWATQSIVKFIEIENLIFVVLSNVTFPFAINIPIPASVLFPTSIIPLYFILLV